MDQVKIGSFLRQLRNEKNLTQEQLADKLGVSPRTVSRWETGSNMPDIAILIELSDYYDVDIRELLDGERKSETMTENINDTLIEVEKYSNIRSKKKATVVIAVISSIFVCSIAFVLLLSARRPVTVKELSSYPVYKQVYIDRAMIESPVREYVINGMAARGAERSNCFTAFKIFSTEETQSGNFFAYAWVDESTYSYNSGVLSLESGSSYPCRFELKRNGDSFTVVGSECPRDGGFYTEDVNSLFPAYVIEMLGSEGLSDGLMQDALEQAKIHFGIS